MFWGLKGRRERRGCTVDALVKKARAFFNRVLGYSQEHNLNPRFFLGLAAIGLTINLLYYLPWGKPPQAEIGFLVSLRLLALAGPLYIFLKGRRIAQVFNLSLLASWSAGTAWHVFYFLYF
jgi:hypothetical protein